MSKRADVKPSADAPATLPCSIDVLSAAPQRCFHWLRSSHFSLKCLTPSEASGQRKGNERLAWKRFLSLVKSPINMFLTTSINSSVKFSRQSRLHHQASFHLQEKTSRCPDHSLICHVSSLPALLLRDPSKLTQSFCRPSVPPTPWFQPAETPVETYGHRICEITKEMGL